MALDTKTILEIRAQTGAGMVDVQLALTEAGGDKEKAIETLRKKGLAKAASKGARSTREGVVHAYIHAGGKVGVLLELLCETDFVARNPEFQSLAQEIALQIAALDPLYVEPSQVPPEVIEKEKQIYKEDASLKGKPDEMVEKILEGKIKKYYTDVCLLNQAYIKDEKMTIEDLVKQSIAKLGENIKVNRFTRYSLG